MNPANQRTLQHRFRLAFSWRFAWAAITAISILSFYVHTIQESMLRGESLRQAQRAAATQPATAYAQNKHDPLAQLALGTIP